MHRFTLGTVQAEEAKSHNLSLGNPFCYYGKWKSPTHKGTRGLG